jgi:hypothetical protein
MDALGIDSTWENSASITSMIVLWWLISFVVNAFLQRNARQNLNTWLRYLAANRSSAVRFSPRGFLTVPSHLLPYVQTAG